MVLDWWYAVKSSVDTIPGVRRLRFQLSLENYLQVLVIATLFQAALHFLVFVDLLSPVLPNFLGEVNQLAGSQWLIGLWQDWSDDRRWYAFFLLQLLKIASLLSLGWVLRKSNAQTSWKRALWNRTSYVGLVFSSFFILHLAAPMQNAGDRLLWILWILCAPYFLFQASSSNSGPDSGSNSGSDSGPDSATLAFAKPHAGWTDRLSIELLQAQAVFLYAGAALSKLADESWRNGHAPALSLVSPAASNPFLPIGPWLVQMDWAPALMLSVGWLTICTEAFIALGLCLRRTRDYAMGLALALHITLLFTHSVMFVQIVSIMALLAWRISVFGLSEGTKQR